MEAIFLAMLALAAPDRAAVALFPIQDSAKRLMPNAVTQLTDYFATKIAEAENFVVVPRSDLESALRKQKGESYKQCFDESCQIEIGKELAAQFVLHTQIVQVGSQCAITATLYNLRLGAAERAASQKADCSEDALVGALEAVARKITDRKSDGAVTEVAPPPPPKAPPPAIETRSLSVKVEPSDAIVLIDGERKGRGAATIRLPIGSKHEMLIERDGFVTHRESIAVDRDVERTIVMKMVEGRRLGRTETFGVSVGLGYRFSGDPVAGLWFRVGNLKVGSLSWVLLDGFFGFSLNRRVSQSGCDQVDLREQGYCFGQDGDLPTYVGTRVGWLLDLGGVSALELSIGPGLHVTIPLFDSDQAGTTFAVSPTIRLLRLGSGAFSYGVGLRAIIPVIPEPACTLGVTDDFDDSFVEAYARCTNRNRFMLQLEVPFGWYD